MKNNLLKSVIISVILLMGVSNAWAAPSARYYLIGDLTSWDKNENYKIKTWYEKDGKYVLYVYAAKDNYFRLKKDDGADYGPSTNGSTTQGYGTYTNENAWKYNGSSGIVRFGVDETSGDNGEHYPYVFWEKVEVKIKHNWNGTGTWSEHGMIDKGDGTYEYTGYYSGTNATNFGIGSDGKTMKYITNATLKGTLSKGNKALFTYNSSGYKGYGSETQNTGSATITRLYTITYDGNGHTDGTVPEAVDKKHGTNITLSNSTPTRTGYTFAGWNTKEDGTGTSYAKGATYSTNADVTLYAQWTGRQYTVTLDYNDGSGGSEKVTATYGSPMPAITIPTREGYTFNGYWTGTTTKSTQYYKADGSSAENWDKAGNTTILYAHWTANTYYVHFDGNGSTSGSMSAQKFDYDQEQPLKANEFIRNGYEFKEWKDQEGNIYEDKQKVKNLSSEDGGTKTLYAQWRPSESYTVTWNPNGGILEGSTDTKVDSYNVDETITKPADPTRKGYTFIGWSPEVSSTMPNNNLTYSAQWECVAPTNLNITGAYVHFPGDDMELTISGDNIAEDATYVWKQGDNVLQDQTTATLIINHCDVTHAGNYVCTVTNGTCSAEANFTVKIFHLYGLKDNSWKQPYVFMKDAETNKAILYVDLDAATTYEFKLKNGREWYWNEGTMTYDNCTDWDMPQEGDVKYGNTKITTTVAGTYAFKLDYSDAANLKLTVIYPSKQTIYLEPGVWDTGNAIFIAHAWTEGAGNDKDIQMTRVDDCSDRIIYEAEIEGAHNRIIFVRCNPSGFSIDNIWSKEWNRSSTQWLTNTLPGYQFNIEAWGEGGTESEKTCSKGSWSAFIPYHTISYNMDGHGTQISDACIQGGNSWSAPTDPTEVGYTFQGWRRPAATGDNKLYKYDQGYKPTASEELTAQWQINQCTVTWKVNAEEEATTVVDIRNQLTTIPYIPTDDVLGCCAEKFIGWSTETNPSKNQVYTTAADLQNLIGTLTANTTKTFHAVFATPVPGAGTSHLTFSEMGYANEEAVTSVTLGDGLGNGDATITFAKGTAATYSPTYYTIGEAVRTYAGNTITVAAATYASTTLTQIDLTFAKGEGNNTITASTGTIADGVWTGDAQSVTFTIDGTTGHRRIAAIAVTTEVTGDKYTNYVTKCDLSNSASIGAGTITYANSATAIDTKCGQRSPASKAATLTFASAQDLTCPVTIEATTGYLVSTNRNDNSKYASSIIVKPVKSGTNKGKLPTIYVRYEANFGATGQIHGTITATGSEIDNTDVAVLANVTCTQYTLTVVDHLGNTINTTNYYEGNEVAEIAQPTPDDCSTNYTFDGWSTEEVAYGSLIYNKVSFPYTMPATDVTLYPVYRLVEDVSEADYHRVTSDLGADNWAGDYLIANAPTIFVDGKTSALSVVDMSGEGIIVNEVISAYYGDPIHVSLISVEGGYVLKTQDGKYIYNTKGQSAGTSVNENLTTADDNPLSVTFTSLNEIVIKNPLSASGTYFSYSSTSKFGFFKGSRIYLYRKSPLYTSSLICEEIMAENAVVTSTAGQTVKVNVTAIMSNMTVNRTRTLTVESDNKDFTATITETATNTYNVAVSYTPAAEQIIDGTDVANITIKVNNIPVNTFQVTGRHLPENFVIAAKWGDNWYALPDNMSSTDSKDGLLIEVDDSSDPTKAIAAPSNTQYALKSVKPGKFANQGERLVFVGNEEKTLYNAEGTSIQVYAQYENYDDDRYEWVPTTIDLKDYTLTSAYIYTEDNDKARTVSLDAHGVFGTLLQNKSYDGMVRLLPVDNFYKPVELQVVEWKANSVSIMYTGVGTHYITQVGDNIATGVLSESIIDHAVYRLSTTDLTTATNQVLTISIKDDAENTIGTLKLTIPWIVSDALSSTDRVASEVAQATDIVVLDGATLTADDTKYTYNDVVVYPGGKLVIDANGKLGMYTLTLRAGSSWGATEYEHKYPEFVLNTKADGAYSNTSGKINLDYVTTKSQYYTFVAPFEVKTKDIKYPVDIYGSNVEAANRGSFEFQDYDGAARAEGKTGWTVVPEGDDGADLEAGQGYTFLGMPKKINGNRQKYGIHRIPMKVSATEAQNHETTNQTVPLSVHLSTKNNNSGWNLIGNPYMTTITGLTNNDIQVGKLVHTNDANGNWTGGWHWDEETVKNNQRFLVIPSNDGQSYEAVQASNATLPAFKNFFVQISNGSANALSIPRTTPAAQLLAPARRTEEVVKDVEVAIVLEQDEAHADQMDFLINNIYTEDFERDADFTKMMNATNFNLYGVHPYDNLSFVAIDNNTARGSVAIGYQVPQAGEYILRMSDKPYVMFDKIEALYVTDHEMSPEVTTDIMSEPYRFTVANAETNHTRFTVSVILKTEEDDGGGDVGTGVDNTTNSNTPCKFIYQDKMYILLNGVIYDAMGKQVQTINK